MFKLPKLTTTNLSYLCRVSNKSSFYHEDVELGKFHAFTNALSRRYCVHIDSIKRPRRISKNGTMQYAEIVVLNSKSTSKGEMTIESVNLRKIKSHPGFHISKSRNSDPGNFTNILRVSSSSLKRVPSIVRPETNKASEIIQPNNQLIKPYFKDIKSKHYKSLFEVNAFLGDSIKNFYFGERLQNKDKLRNIFYKNVDLYNELLRGLAEFGYHQQLEMVLKAALKDEVEFNVHTYALIFECYGRRLIKENFLKDLRHFTKELHKKGLTFDDIMNEAVFLKNGREMVIKALQAVDPQYSTTFKKPDLQYDNALINHLNHEDQLDNSQCLRKDFNNKPGLFTKPMMEKLIDEQLKAEREGFVNIKNIQTKSIVATDEVEKYNEARKEYLKNWEVQAARGFKTSVESTISNSKFKEIRPYLLLLPTKNYVQIIINAADSIASGSDTYGPSFQYLYRELGLQVYNKYDVLFKEKKLILDKILKIHGEYCDHYADLHSELEATPTQVNYSNERQRWQTFEHLYKGEGATLLKDHQKWPSSVISLIGEFLYKVMLKYLTIDINILKANKKKHFQSAFFVTNRTESYRMQKNSYKPHPKLKEVYRKSISETLKFSTNLVPMKCPPIPWLSFETGGYILAPCDLVRLHIYADMQKQNILNAKPNSMYPTLDALNQLSAVPWKINTEILDILLKVFCEGGSVKLDIPRHPSLLPKPQNNEKMYLYHKEKDEMFSLWCDCLYRLSLANHFRDDIIWLPHNIDFRGRAYPIPPHLNHLGSDMARSMLLFAEKRPLGSKGFDWLKIHLINLTGLKKRSNIQDRLNYANEIFDDILDSADNPLEGKGWWTQSDEPWQTLACCKEIAAAYRSPNPEEFRSGYAVHQDGSCNGLQHYAALGRDPAGAFSVNLKCAPLPQDVYSVVVDLVEKQRIEKAKEGNELAKCLEGFIKRKIIKQTIMTTVYGVTQYGARLQIQKQLRALDNFPQEHLIPASNYLTKMTFEALTSMFTSTRLIQNWFTQCAQVIAKVKGKQVEWVTPLGLPIVQPYIIRKYSNINVGDNFQLPDTRKQKNAFAPNFVHSLDSSHMILTSLHCERAGIVFVSVHDCFWTHPSTVHIMNKICREQFVVLHSQNILEDLSMSFFEKFSFNDDEMKKDGSVADLKRYKLNEVLRKLPKTGNFDIKNVLDSTYFFS